jgi:hypothetical protein
VTVQVPEDVTDEGMQLVCTRFPAITCLTLSCRANVTDVGMRAVSGLIKLTTLDLSGAKM